MKFLGQIFEKGYLKTAFKLLQQIDNKISEP
jgi:hypothetical protein